MKVVQFEGNPEEFKAVAHLFGESAPPIDRGSVNEREDTAVAVEPQVAIRRMLTRIPISKGQMAVYKALANGRLEYSQFLARTNRSSAVMAGVLGALGRRINNTKEIHQAGLPGDTSAILKWEKEDGRGYYSLTPDALEALKAEGVV